MGERYSDILRGAQLKKALDNYLKYLSGEVDRQPNIGNGKAREERTVLYVRPFGTKLALKQFAEVSGNQGMWEARKEDFKGFTTDAINAKEGETSFKFKGFRAARASYKTGINPKGTPETSNATKMKYLDYGGTSRSLPFGDSETAVTEDEAFKILKATFKLSDKDKTSRLYWQREKY